VADSRSPLRAMSQGCHSPAPPAARRFSGVLQFARAGAAARGQLADRGVKVAENSRFWRLAAAAPGFSWMSRMKACRAFAIGFIRKHQGFPDDRADRRSAVTESISDGGGHQARRRAGAAACHLRVDLDTPNTTSLRRSRYGPYSRTLSATWPPVRGGGQHQGAHLVVRAWAMRSAPASAG